jgi:hypothetical protein
MPQSFKNAWRWLVGASAAAMLIASMSPAANAQSETAGLITLCIAKNGKIVGIDVACKSKQLQLTWNIPGPQGPPGEPGSVGPAGPPGEVGPTGATGNIGNQGPQGPTGSPGATGPTGSQGGVGAVGMQGPMGSKGLTGPAGVQGVTGVTGLPGNPGLVKGAKGPVGPKGTPSQPPGDFVTVLSGGTLGTTIGTMAGIQLSPTTGTGTGLLAFPLYMGPGNGASVAGIATPPGAPQASVEVPTPGGNAFNLQVLISPAGVGPGNGGDYIFIVCNEATCDPTVLACDMDQDTPTPLTTCASNSGSGVAVNGPLAFLPGDTLSIQAFNSEMSTNTVDVSWSLDYAINPADVGP